VTYVESFLKTFRVALSMFSLQIPKRPNQSFKVFSASINAQENQDNSDYSYSGVMINLHAA